MKNLEKPSPPITTGENLNETTRCQCNKNETDKEHSNKKTN